MAGSSSGGPTPLAGEVPNLLVQGGAVAEACRPVIQVFGLETAVDVLTAEEDADVLSFIAKKEAEDKGFQERWARMVRWAGAREKEHRKEIRKLAEEGVTTPVPTQTLKRPPVQRQPAVPPARPAAKVVPSKRKRTPEELDTTDVSKRRRAAERIADIVESAKETSALQHEIPLHAEGAAKWKTAFVDVLAGEDGQAGFEANTLQKAASTWSRWTLYCKDDGQVPEFEPSALALRDFLKGSAERGPTAAAGDWQCLAWLQRHAGLTGLPLDAAIVRQYRRPKAGHQECQQVPLKLEGLETLLQVMGDNQAEPWKRCAAALITRVLLSCLRWAHVTRASYSAAESTARTQVWSVFKGKGADRAGFKVSLPTHAAPEVPFEPHLEVLLEGLDAQEKLYLVPDIIIGQQGLEGPCIPGTGRMSRAKFFNIDNCLLAGAHGQAVTGYTLRRWLPSIAGTLQLPIERRHDLGNWRDVLADGESRVSEPMAVRYSEQRLEATASVKRLCLAAVLHLLKWTSAKKIKPEWDKLQGCIRSLENLERYTHTPQWGADQGPRSEVHQDEEIPLFNDTSDGTTSTSSSSVEASSDVEDVQGPEPQCHTKLVQLATEMHVQWIAPQRSSLIHVARPGWAPTSHTDATPLCKDTPFVTGYLEGLGAASATDLHRDWCRRCLRRLPAIQREEQKLNDAAEQT